MSWMIAAATWLAIRYRASARSTADRQSGKAARTPGAGGRPRGIQPGWHDAALVACQAMNEELRQLYEADQADRRGGQLSPDVSESDRARRRRVAELLDVGAVESGEDFFHAAMVFQHGDGLDDYQRARELALRAAELGHRPGRWLAAAALDRWLMRQGRPQKYGTQYRSSGGAYELYEVEPATTDDERAEWDVPPLAEARRRAGDMAALPARAPSIFRGEPAVTFMAGGLELRIHVVDSA